MTNKKANNYDYLVILEKHDGRFAVYGYDTYPTNSVLAGQDRKNYLNTFSSLKQAKTIYPDSELSHYLLLPTNSFDHLSDDSDYWKEKKVSNNYFILCLQFEKNSV